MGTTPYTISTIIQQAGGMGLQGAFCYIGASNLTYKHPSYYREHECRPSAESSVSPEHGGIEHEVGIMFKVNGKRGQGWHMAVCYEPDDTYTVYLLKLASRKERTEGRIANLLDWRRDVYCDGLQHTIESMYDRAIKNHNGGFINI